jgi:hypothetical protein
MRADMIAGYFDIKTTGKLMEAIQRGEAPPSTATRMHNGRRVPVWSRAACDAFIQQRHGLAHDLVAANDNSPISKEVEFA